ncbi:MAG: histidine phosphatase family protein [Aeromicrobium sp.]|uniref:histidine phosphatase family protein n=1 Tax=Aeromicrobium sp. TaxID=1871063 RepID=UPI0039E2DCCB
MATVILVRHGRTTANASGLLPGRSPGVHLDDTGRSQAVALSERISPLPLAALVTSPLERCRETADAVLERQRADLPVIVDDAITECDYGQWQGRPLSELLAEDLWKTVQRQPSAVAFPGGESMPAMQARAVAAIRSRDAAITAEHGPEAVWVAVSHGDIIKSVLADAYGLHLDLFQRIHVDPASATIIRYGRSQPRILGTNTHAGDLAWLARTPQSADAPVGGGSGPAEAAGSWQSAGK